MTLVNKKELNKFVKEITRTYVCLAHGDRFEVSLKTGCEAWSFSFYFDDEGFLILTDDLESGRKFCCACNYEEAENALWNHIETSDKEDRFIELFKFKKDVIERVKELEYIEEENRKELLKELRAMRVR